MKRYVTDRLTVAISLSLAGALIAVLLGMPEVALFVAPWLVLCAIGMSQDPHPELHIGFEVNEERLLVGDVVELEVTVTSTSEVRVGITPEPSRAFRSVANEVVAGETVDLVTPRAPARVVFELPADEWGTHDLGAAAIEIESPYALFRTKGSPNQRRLVRVHPTPRQLQELLTPWIVRTVSGTHRSKESARGIEYADIREFAAGDSVRDINWRATARRGELWVSQRHPDRATDVVLLVDSFVESGHDVRKIFGLVVESAVALAESHLAATDRVGLIEFGGLVRWVTPATGRVQLQRLTDALLATGLWANAADKELPILPPRALPPRSFVVAFTPLLDQRFVEAIFTARGRGHDVAVIECAPFDEAAGDDATAAERLASRLWRAERSMLRDRMAEQGIAVAEWDGTEHLDVTLDRLIRRRRKTVRTGGR